jgi:hypothetical protein
MPKLLVVKWLEFFVFSGDIKEQRRHVHLASRTGKSRDIAKFWLEPEIEVDFKGGFTNKEANEIKKVIAEHLDILNEQLDKFFAGKKVDYIKE